MTTPDFPPPVPAADFGALATLAETFAAVVRAETAALRDGDRAGFERLTGTKEAYHAALKTSMTVLEPKRAGARPAERQRWEAAATACEAALQENGQLIAGQQLHNAALLDLLRRQLRQQQSSMVGYGRDARPRQGS